MAAAKKSPVTRTATPAGRFHGHIMEVQPGSGFRAMLAESRDGRHGRGTALHNVFRLARDRGLAPFYARVHAAKGVDPGRFACVAGRAEAVGEHRAYAGRGREDAGAVRQTVAVKREAEHAFPEHDRSGGVAGITASLDSGRPHALDLTSWSTNPDGTERDMDAGPLRSCTMRPSAKKGSWRGSVRTDSHSRLGTLAPGTSVLLQGRALGRVARPLTAAGGSAVMEQSAEVRRILSSLFEAVGTPRMSSVFTDAIAAEPGVLGVGTDPAEWWDNPDDLLRAVQAQGQELQGATATVIHSQGWTEGGIGWGAAKADVLLPGAPTTTIRLTATLARRSGNWKIVQLHASVGAANEEVVGKDLTV
jgi:hypothetical protein